MTAVNGGSISFVAGVILPGMYGTTYPSFEPKSLVTERVRDRGLADYVRWEYRAGDRVSVILSARGGAILGSRPRPPRRPILPRLAAWVKARRAGAARNAVVAESATRD